MASTDEWIAKRSGPIWVQRSLVLRIDGLAGKLGFYDQSFHIPCIVRDPRPSADASRSATVGAYTENVDLVPTMLDWLGLDIPLQCDGSSLGPFLSGEPRPIGWREGAHHEFDWRYWPLAPGRGSSGWPADRSMDAKCLSVLRDERGTYVQFGDGTALFFDRTADPEERASDLTHPDAFRFARRMLSWRLRNADRVLAGAFTDREGLRGRLPPLPWVPLIGKTLTGKPLTR